MTRKRRTRGHVIADLSMNRVERFVLLCGWSAQRQSPDYGIDLTIHTYNHDGEIENGYVQVQVKGTDHIAFNSRGTAVLCSIRRSDLQHWLSEPFPVILIQYDAQADQAYWLHIQEYFHSRAGFPLHPTGHTLSVHIPASHLLTCESVVEFARRKDTVLQEFWG